MPAPVNRAEVSPLHFLRRAAAAYPDKAAVIHDAGYGNALVTENGDRIFATKHLSDRLFLEGMGAEGVPSITAWPMYQAVVMFGNPLGHPLRRAHVEG